MVEPETLREKDGSNQETKKEGTVSMRKVLSCDLKTLRLRIKYKDLRQS